MSQEQTSTPQSSAEIGVKLGLIALVLLWFGGLTLVGPLLARAALPAWAAGALLVAGLAAAHYARVYLLRRDGKIGLRAVLIMTALYFAVVLGALAVAHVVRRAA